MRPILYATLLLLLADAHAQTPANAFGAEPGPYSVGFRLIEEQDPSRTVFGRPRPVRTYLWYPAETARRARPMRFARYAALADDDVWPAEIVGNLHDKLSYSRRPLARSLGGDGFAALLERTVLAVENARPVRGPFPLIVIGTGFWYEPAISVAALGEYLAGRGFVVATAPLVGTSSPFVRVDEQDLETQVRDLEFVTARARQLAFVSQDKLGVVGFDMGGMAMLLMAMRNRDVDAFVCLGSGILFEHPSGLPRISPGYDPLALRVPWLHLTPPEALTPPPGSRAPSLFESAKYAERYLLPIPNMVHVDFTIEGLIEGRSSMPGYWQVTPGAGGSRRGWQPYVLSFLAAFVAGNTESPAFLSQLEHRAAAPAPITHEEFVAAVVAGRSDEAIRRLESEPAALNENDLQRLSANLVFTWGLGKEAIPVIELLIRRYPARGYQALLAEAHILLGDYRTASDLYSKVLDQFPNNAIARARLEWLRSKLAAF